MDKTACEECMAYCICPQKPKREDYADENKYLIDLECGAWSCKNTVQELCKENAKLKEQIEKMKSDVKEMAERADKNGDMLALKRMSELFEKWELAE